MSFDRINAKMPDVRLADPAEPTKLMQVASLQMVAAPFLPPVVEVRDLKGTFEFTATPLVDEVGREAPGSQSPATGRYVYTSSDMTLAARRAGRGRRPALALPAAARERGRLARLPDDVGEGIAGLRGAERRHHLGGRTRRQLRAALGDSVAFHDTDLRVAVLDTRTIEQMVPSLPRRAAER